MHKKTNLVILLIIPLSLLALTGCARLSGASTATTAEAGTATLPETTTTRANPVYEICSLTQPTTELPPSVTAASFTSTWYRSADDKIWASLTGLWYGGSKVLWAKPAGNQLEVSGRRLDGEAPPMKASLPDGYHNADYQASDLSFPTAGCWEVEARAEDSVLRFVTYVYPRTYRPPGGRCSNLADAVENSDAILVGEVEGTAPDRPGFVWQTVRVKQVWKTPSIKRPTLGQDSLVEILVSETGEPRLEYKQNYLLFLQSQPGYPWRIFCEQRTMAQVTEEQTLRFLGGADPVWSGDTLAVFTEQLQPLLSPAEKTP